MTSRILLSVPVLALSCQMAFAQPTTGPVIDGYGAAFVIDNADVPLIPDHEYRVVFEITGYGQSPDGVNRNLERVARFLNLHAKNGVDPADMHLAVVIHGAALVNALHDDAYQTRLEMANPNLDLARRLASAGVEFYVCGQSMGMRGFAKSELAEPFKLATSALTMVHQLQAQGYTFQP
jgi:intracellular sulfur oxidation DsrE/DsrF family protein